MSIYYIYLHVIHFKLYQYHKIISTFIFNLYQFKIDIFQHLPTFGYFIALFLLY